MDQSGGKLSLFPFSAGERTQEFTGKTLLVGTGNLFPSWRLGEGKETGKFATGLQLPMRVNLHLGKKGRRGKNGGGAERKKGIGRNK